MIETSVPQSKLIDGFTIRTKFRITDFPTEFVGLYGLHGNGGLCLQFHGPQKLWANQISLNRQLLQIDGAIDHWANLPDNVTERNKFDSLNEVFDAVYVYEKGKRITLYVNGVKISEKLIGADNYFVPYVPKDGATPNIVICCAWKDGAPIR